MKKVSKQTKRIMSVLLAMVMIVLTVPLAFGVSTVKSGTFGNGFSWTFDSDKRLTIRGSGDMPDFSVGGTDLPWIELRGYIVNNDLIVESLVIENGITRIGDYSFERIPVKSVSIPESVKSIGKSAFSYTLLTEVYIPSSITKIELLAFSSQLLTKYIVSGSNPSYSAGSDGCLYNKDKTALIDYPWGRLDAHYSFPDTVKTFDENPFNSLFLTSIYIPKSLTKTPELFSCPKLEKVTVDSSNPVFSSDTNGCLYNKDKTDLLLYPAGTTRASFSIPGSVKSISTGAFSTAMNLKSVQLPSNVKTVGFSAFTGCVNLNDVSLSEGLERIDESAFSYCVSLTQILLPQSVSYVGFDAFFASGLKKISVLNPNCKIDLTSHHYFNLDGSPVTQDKQGVHKIFADATIYGYEGSTAQSYALAYDHQFVSLGTSPVPVVMPDEPATDNGKVSLGKRIQNAFNRFLEFIRSLIYRLTHIF